MRDDKRNRLQERYTAGFERPTTILKSLHTNYHLEQKQFSAGHVNTSTKILKLTVAPHKYATRNKILRNAYTHIHTYSDPQRNYLIYLQ